MQGEVEVGQSTAAWVRDAGAAGAIAILGGVIVALLRQVPNLVPGALHRERIAALEAQVTKCEAETEEWKKLTLSLLTPLEKSLRDTRPRG